MIWFLPAIFVLVHGPNGDSTRTYEGQSVATIQAMIASEGKTADFLTQTEFDAYVAAHAAPVLTDAQINLKQRSDAIDNLSGGTADKDKLSRAILLTIFDENNNLRQWIQAFKGQVAAASSLADLKTRVAGLPDTPDRTIAQAKTAVQNKINSGASD